VLCEIEKEKSGHLNSGSEARDVSHFKTGPTWKFLTIFLGEDTDAKFGFSNNRDRFFDICATPDSGEAL
jgi:hypothetical protein